jgi:probable lipoprotein NlpC
MNIRNLFVLAFIFILLNGCALAAKKDAQRVSHTAGTAVIDLNNKHLLETLYLQHEEWKGVKYKVGGLGKKGIDCSGFVYMTFKSKLGVKLPRTTELQAQLGKPIDKGKLKAGDLVFFKTSLYVRHVGIYLEKGLFLHASKSKGVMISKLNNVYWKSKYWKAKRIET